MDFLPEDNFNQHLAKKHLIEDLDSFIRMLSDADDTRMNALLRDRRAGFRDYILKWWGVDIDLKKDVINENINYINLTKKGT